MPTLVIMTLFEQVQDKQSARARSRPEPIEFDRTLLLAPLVLMHFVLAYLVRLQYSQEVSLRLVLSESWVSIPVFWALLSLPRSYFNSKLSQALLVVAGTIVGCYLVYIANEEGYFATMKKAPPLGTLFAWLFIELYWYNAVVSLAAVASYLWFTGYSL